MVPPCGFKSHYLHHVAADFICSQRLFYASHQKSLLTHSVAAPLQTESASLGFGLGSFHGSLFPSTLSPFVLLTADDLRRDFLPREQIADRIEHGGRTAVVFGHLIAQWIVHGSDSLLFFSIKNQLFTIRQLTYYVYWLIIAQWQNPVNQ